MNALLQRLRPRSIRSRLLWWFTGAIVLALCLVYLLALLQQQRLIRSEWSAGLRAQALLIATNSQAAVDFQDRQEAARLLQAVQSSPSVLRARLLLAGRREPFAEFARQGSAVAATPSPPLDTQDGQDMHFGNNQVVAWAAVPGSAGKAHVELVASTQDMQQVLWRTALETGGALLALLLLLLWLSGRAARRLVVVSALFGALRITDRIPAYRLSMGVTLPAQGRLAALWREPLGQVLPDEVGRGLIVDARSAAYAAAWTPTGALAERWVHIRVPGVSHLAKHTRGLVARAACESASDPRHPAGLATILTDAGFRVELGAPAKRGAPWILDVTAP